jgi:hypothetical protein
MNEYGNSIRYPDMRCTLLYNLYDLSDKEQQRLKWINPSLRFNFAYEVGEIITILFNDFGLADKPFKSNIGILFYNLEEEEAVQSAVQALNVICEKFSLKDPDEVYYTSPLWDEVVRTAKYALETMLQYEPPGTFFRRVVLKEPAVGE